MECITFEADQRMLREAAAHPNQPFTVQGILLMIAGSNCGVKPTARAKEKRKASNIGRDK